METNQQDMQVSQPVEKPLIKCRKQKESTLACFNEDCKLYPFVCSQKDCECQKDHEDCSMLVTDKLEKAVRKKIVTLKPLQQKIEVYFEQVIDKVSAYRDQLLQKLQKSFRNYFGLSDLEEEFLKFFDTGDKNKLNGQKFWQIQSHLKCKSQTALFLNNKFEKINKILTNFEQQIEAFKLTLTKKIQKLQTNNFQNSKIITTDDQQDLIENLFGKRKIKSASLVYRASQNNFQLENFFKNCKDIRNTLIICKTEFNTIIGGFTSQDWKADNLCYGVDQTFTFSYKIVTAIKNNFSIKSSQSFIQFGESDLYIPNKANQNNCKCSRVFQIFNQTRSANKIQTYQVGGRLPFINFKLKQWEVFHLQFQAE